MRSFDAYLRVSLFGSILACFSCLLHPFTYAWADGAKICVGFNPDEQYWGRKGREETSCSSNYAMYGTAVPAGPSYPPKAVRFGGSCCPLPSEEVLTEEQVVVPAECPEGFVVTATLPGPLCREFYRFSFCDPEEGMSLRCTKINTKRYQLGPKTPGILWGVSATAWKQGRHIKRIELPAAIRFGLGRISKYRLTSGGCVGDPYGSLLVAKQSKRCSDLIFRELQYKGLPGDPPQGTSVEMFPRCRFISDRFEQHPTCVDQDSVELGE